jgi:multicomponent K+:H+ antiporter subunit F
MSPVVSHALAFATGCFALGLMMNLWRLMRGPGLVDRLLALDTMVVNVIALILLGGLAAGTSVNFEAALLFALTGFVSSVALSRFVLRGNIIE